MIGTLDRMGAILLWVLVIVITTTIHYRIKKGKNKPEDFGSIYHNRSYVFYALYPSWRWVVYVITLIISFFLGATVVTIILIIAYEYVYRTQIVNNKKNREYWADPKKGWLEQRNWLLTIIYIILCIGALISVFYK